MSDPEQTTDEQTPASPDPAPAKAHGDAFTDQSGSRHGRPGAGEADAEEDA